MKRGVCFAALAMIGAWAGCAQPQERVSYAPDPIFDTRPRKVVPKRRVVPKRTIPSPRPPRKLAARPDWTPSGGITGRWTDVIIHHSGSATGGADAFDDYHRRVQKWDELGYHFVIGNGSDTANGEVEVGPRWIKQKHGAHCRTSDNFYNRHGIGICLVGNFEKSSPTSAQLTSLNRLLIFLTDRCGIPPSRVSSHGAVTGRTACPGRNFPLAMVRQNLAASRPAVAHASHKTSVRLH